MRRFLALASIVFVALGITGRCAGSSVASNRLADDRVRVVGRQFVGDTADQRGHGRRHPRS